MGITLTKSFKIGPIWLLILKKKIIEIKKKVWQWHLRVFEKQCFELFLK